MHDTFRRLVTFFFCLLTGGYLIQAFSPLRINTDAYTLLSMAVSAYQGNGYLVDGHSAKLPIGYPFLVETLLHAGLASSMSLVLLNLVCLFAGLLAWHVWFKMNETSALTIMPIAFVLSSWVMVKHVTLPLTELLYFAVSSFSLFFACLFFRERGPKMWWWFTASTLLAYLAFQCRSVGIVFFPVLALTALCHPTIFAGLVLRRKLRYVIVSSLVVSLFVIIIIKKTGLQLVTREGYVYDVLQSLIQQRASNVFIQNLLYRILEFGEVFSNMPSSQAPQFLLIFYLVGLVAWMVVLYGAYRLYPCKPFFPLLLYFVSYAALMLAWPFYDPRYWLPLLPVLIIMLLTAVKDLESHWPPARFAFRLYMVVFFVLGSAALLISTRVSLSGKDFSEVFGKRGERRMSYRFAFNNGEYVDMSKVDTGTVRLLRIFEPLATTKSEQEEGQQPDTAGR